MDDADKAQRFEELEREAAVQAARESLPALPDVGYCYYCNEPTERGKRFCDDDCRDDWQRSSRSTLNFIC